MEDDIPTPEDVRRWESIHAAAVRVKYGLAMCRFCGWPVTAELLDVAGVCPWCVATMSDIDQGQ